MWKPINGTLIVGNQNHITVENTGNGYSITVGASGEGRVTAPLPEGFRLCREVQDAAPHKDASTPKKPQP